MRLVFLIITFYSFLVGDIHVFNRRVSTESEIKTIEVEWYRDGYELEVAGFSIDGKLIREYNDVPQNRLWGNRDEILVSSLIMWGELEDEL